MPTTLLIRPSLAIGHAAVALVALASFHVALPAAPLASWQVAGRVMVPSSDKPRRLPCSRRADRIAID